MRIWIKRLLVLLTLALIVGLGIGVFFYVWPEEARYTWAKVRTYLDSPRLRGWNWPSIEEGRFSVTYEDGDVPRDYADAVLRIAEKTEQILNDELGRGFLRDIDIFLFTEEGQNYLWTNGSNEVHLVFEDANDMLPPGMGGERNHVAQISHTLALLVGQIRSGTADDPLPQDRASDALATYIEMNLIVPGLWRSDGDLLWPAPYDYHRDSNPEIYARYAPDPPAGREAGRFWGPWDTFWYRLDRIGGPEAVGQVLNQAAGPVGHASVDALARGVTNVTGQEDLAEFVRQIGAD